VTPLKILYGVCGEGMGHATRSDVVARHLTARGHHVQFACDEGRALEYLRGRWGSENVAEVPGFKLSIQNNRVMLTRTLLENAATHLLSSGAHVISALGVREPDVVVNDFSAWTTRYAQLLRKPMVALDNIHFMTRCRHPQEWIDAHRDEAAAAMLVTETAVPEASFYIVLAFTRQAPVSQPLTALHLPVVRDAVSQQPVSDGGHLVVYFNDKADWSHILGVLHRAGRSVRAYGCPGVKEVTKAGNVTLCPVSDALVEDLASCSAAVSGAGFSFLSEALALRKPLLAVPYEGSFEQILNGRYLDREGFGTWAPRLGDDVLGRFLSRLEPMRARLAAFPNDRNQGLFDSLDRLLETL
jgi:uncharacterized protein (TIGR00661 family)